MRFTQLVAAQWDGRNGLNFSLFALGDDGQVYRYSVADKAWIAYPTKVAERHPTATEEPF